MPLGLSDRQLGTVTSEGSARSILQILVQPFVIAEHCSTNLENPLRTLRPVPELLRPFHPVVELLDQRLHGAARDRQAKASITRIVHAALVVLQVRHRLGHHYPRIAARWLLLRRNRP